MHTIRLTFLFWAVLSSAAFSQDWTPYGPHHESVVKVSCSNGSGTGVVVRIGSELKNGNECYVLTAYHVVEDGENIKVTYRNGKRAKGCKVINCSKEGDIALVWAWAPSGVQPVDTFDQEIKRGDSLEFVGLGGGVPLSRLRSFIGRLSILNESQIFADSPLMAGDSGGPVFYKRKLVGIISGGWFWVNGRRRTTWPARAAGPELIEEMMEGLDE